MPAEGARGAASDRQAASAVPEAPGPSEDAGVRAGQGGGGARPRPPVRTSKPEGGSPPPRPVGRGVLETGGRWTALGTPFLPGRGWISGTWCPCVRGGDPPFRPHLTGSRGPHRPSVNRGSQTPHLSARHVPEVGGRSGPCGPRASPPRQGGGAVWFPKCFKVAVQALMSPLSVVKSGGQNPRKGGSATSGANSTHAAAGPVQPGPRPVLQTALGVPSVTRVESRPFSPCGRYVTWRPVRRAPSCGTTSGLSPVQPASHTRVASVLTNRGAETLPGDPAVCPSVSGSRRTVPRAPHVASCRTRAVEAQGRRAV